MRNPHGSPIWYELLTEDRERSTDFYGSVFGWTVGDRPDGPMDYRMIETPDGEAGGLMQLTPDMLAGGARTGWFVYFGVDDVDAAVDRVTALGGSVRMPAVDMEGVGRMALVADPQGLTFYVMRGAVDEPSRAWSPDGMAKCNWNELVAADPDAARAFYGDVLGWSWPDRMAMPEGMGDYVFAEAGGETIGAVMGPGAGQPVGWTFYFRAQDIDAAADAVRAGGGTVHAGPMDVPGGDRVIVASDPMGAPFGVVATSSERG